MSHISAFSYIQTGTPKDACNLQYLLPAVKHIDAPVTEQEGAYVTPAL